MLKYQHKILPTSDMEPTLVKFLPNIWRISDLNGPFWDIPKEEPSSRKLTTLLSQKQNSPSTMVLTSSTALDKPLNVLLSIIFRKKSQQNMGHPRKSIETNFGCIPRWFSSLAKQHSACLWTSLGHRHWYFLKPLTNQRSLRLAQSPSG